MIKCVHTADLHFGVTTYGKDTPDGLGTRVKDFLKTFGQIKNFIFENNIDILIIAGDIFKEREPNSTIRDIVYKELVEIANYGTQIVLIPGNHDMHPFEYRHNNLQVLDIFNIPNVHLFNRLFPDEKKINTKIIDVRGQKIRIIGIPYPYIERISASFGFKFSDEEELSIRFADEIVNRIDEAINALPQIPTIVVGHLTIVEANTGSEQGLMLSRDIKLPLSVFTNKNLSYVALGHIHKPQILCENPYVVYPGSPDRIDFSEINDEKGFMYIEIDKKVNCQFIRLRVRPFFEFDILLDEPKEDENIKKEIFTQIDENILKFGESSFKNAVIKININARTVVKEKINIKEIREYLEDRCFYVANINIEIIDNINNFRMVQIDESTNPIEAFERYLNATDRYKDYPYKKDVIDKFKQLLAKVEKNF